VDSREPLSIRRKNLGEKEKLLVFVLLKATVIGADVWGGFKGWNRKKKFAKARSLHNSQF